MDWSVLMQDGVFATVRLHLLNSSKHSKQTQEFVVWNKWGPQCDWWQLKTGLASGVLHPPESRVTCSSPETLSSDLTHQCDSHCYSSTTEQNASVSKPLVDRVRELLNNRSICYPRAPDGAVCGWSPVFEENICPVHVPAAVSVR